MSSAALGWMLASLFSAGCRNLKALKVWRTGVTPAGIQELRNALPHLRVTQ